MTSLLTTLFALGVLIAASGPAHATDLGPSPQPSPTVREFSDEYARDFNLRSEGQLQLSNLRGNIRVIGWSQDKIRVQAHRRVYVETEAQAKAAFAAMGFIFQETSAGVECAAQYGRGLDIEQRVEERERPAEFQSKMDMVVYAPSRLTVKIWTDAGASSLKNWNNAAELRTVSGDIEAENVSGGKLSSLCQNCSVKFSQIRGSIRAITDGGNISVSGVGGPDLFLETAAGDISAENVRGDQLYVTRSGTLKARDLRGRVEFQTQQGSVDISGLRGFASGKTETGAIHLRANEWEFHDKAIIESDTGDIVLSLPSSFVAEVDLRSGHGKVECSFPVHHAVDQPVRAGRLVGRIGEQTTDLLKVSSNTGNIQLLGLVR